jgi:hypothetical protein
MEIRIGLCTCAITQSVETRQFLVTTGLTNKNSGKIFSRLVVTWKIQMFGWWDLVMQTQLTLEAGTV